MRDREFLPAVVIFYGVFAIAALVWMWVRGEPLARAVTPGEPSGALLEVGIGAGFGLLVVVVGRIMERRFEFARSLSDHLAQMIPGLTTSGIAVVAVASSLGEELLFRGAMQDAWGLWPTAAIFAIVHGFFDRKLIVWMVFAGVMGVAFGYMTRELGTITAPVVAHFTINYVNLHLLIQRNGGGESP